jgi:ABC-type phosphate transport system substrate-binding protein
MPPRPLAAIAALAAALLAAPGAARAQDELPGGVRVIVNPATPVATLAREQLSRLFLRKVARWDGGTPVLPVDLAESSPARDAFTRAVHRRSVSMIAGYWQRQIFSGRQLPPPDRASEAEVVAYVRGTPGAIGYVSASAELRGVRVVTVTAR